VPSGKVSDTPERKLPDGALRPSEVAGMTGSSMWLPVSSLNVAAAAAFSCLSDFTLRPEEYIHFLMPS
jgi:hypothetical protein